jgi:WD40 repeat protein
MKLVQIFEDRHATGIDTIIQAMAFPSIKPKSSGSSSLGSDASDLITDQCKLVVIGTFAGNVKLIDLKKNKVIWKERFGGDSSLIFDLDWNIDGILAIASTNNNLELRQYTGEAQSMFNPMPAHKMNESVRCLQFSPINKNLLAAGLFKGSIVIVDVTTNEATHVIKESSSRIASIRWHPTFDYILASGTHDNIVRVHDIKNQGFKQIDFHSNRVPGLEWSYELPWLLITAADDSKVALWDIRHQIPILVQESLEPSLSLNGFASHPNRPFSIISSHFDASIKQWTLLGLPDVGLALIKLILGLPLTEIICNEHDMMQSSVSAKLSGKQSEAVYEQMKSNFGSGNYLEGFKKIMEFFSGQDG